MTEKHIFGADTISQYKLLEQILDDYSYTDEGEMLLKYDINKKSSDSIEVIEKETGNKKIYTYDTETKTIKKENIL